jgi:DNA damage-inducible protein 1
MARLTITVNASGEPNDQDLVTLEVPLSMTVAEFKELLESETKFAIATQNLFFEGNMLSTATSTLESLNIKDGDMLALMINVARPRSRPQQQGQQRQNANDPSRIEEVRQRVLADPGQLSALLQQVPDLATAINSPEQFRAVWMAMVEAKERESREREARQRLENEDPFNTELQHKIMETLRRENIEKNLQYAYEHNPAGQSFLIMPKSFITNT